MVDLDSKLNSFLVNLESKFDFPTPESPIKTTEMCTFYLLFGIKLKKQKLKVKDRLHSISLRESRKSKKETQARYKNLQVDLFNKGKDSVTQNK